MKLKLKFDKKTILDFLLQNVEKIVLGLFVLIFLLLLYSSLSSASRFEKTPDQLLADTTRAQRDIESTTIEDYKKAMKEAGASGGADPSGGMSGNSSGGSMIPTVDHGLTITDYPSQATRVRIDEKPYAHLARWNSRVFTTKPLRTEPPLLTVRDLRVRAGMGAFRLIPAASQGRGRTGRGGDATATATEQVRGLRWIVLTALVPFEKQVEAYAETFRTAKGYNSQTDYPTYLGYWVERVEVNGADDAPDWTKATKIVSSKEIDRWSQQWSSTKETELVAPQYLEPRLVFPLGPLVNRRWDADVAHEPKIPVQRASDRTQGLEGRGGAAGIRPAGGRMGNEMLGVAGGGLANRMLGGDARGGGQVDTDGTPFGEEEAAGNRKERDEAVQEDVQDARNPEYRLLRFFDFNVEPGKRYVYRVCLGLQNPNYGVRTADLANADLAKKSWLQTKWSDPSPAISVLRDTQVLLSSVKPGRGYAEPSAEIVLTTWLQRKGVEVYKDFTVTRGQVANYTGQSGTIAGGGSVRNNEVNAAPVRTRGLAGGGALEAIMGRGAAAPGPAGAARQPQTQTTTSSSNTQRANFLSDAIVIDMRGGDKLQGVGRRTSDLTSGGEILLFDAEGRLVIHDELDDEAARDQLKPTSNTTGGADRGLGAMFQPAAAPGRTSPLEGIEAGKKAKTRKGR